MYTNRQRERERGVCVCACMCIYIHTYIHSKYKYMQKIYQGFKIQETQTPLAQSRTWLWEPWDAPPAAEASEEGGHARSHLHVLMELGEPVEVDDVGDMIEI